MLDDDVLVDFQNILIAPRAVVFRVAPLETLLPRVRNREIGVVLGEVVLVVLVRLVAIVVLLVVVIGLETRRAAAVVVGKRVLDGAVVLSVLVYVLVAVRVGDAALRGVSGFRIGVVISVGFAKGVGVGVGFLSVINEVVVEWFLR